MRVRHFARVTVCDVMDSCWRRSCSNVLRASSCLHRTTCRPEHGAVARPADLPDANRYPAEPLAKPGRVHPFKGNLHQAFLSLAWHQRRPGGVEARGQGPSSGGAPLHVLATGWGGGTFDSPSASMVVGATLRTYPKEWVSVPGCPRRASRGCRCPPSSPGWRSRCHLGRLATIAPGAARTATESSAASPACHCVRTAHMGAPVSAPAPMTRQILYTVVHAHAVVPRS